MRPLRQGALDGLCGLYAIVNAMDVLGTPLRPSVQRQLFGELTYALGAATILSAIDEGMDALTLQRAAELAFRWLATTHDIKLEVTLPFNGRRLRSASKFVKALRPLVEAPDAAVIIAFKTRSKGHWSVVKEIEGETIRLWDSDGMVALHTAGFEVGVGRRQFWPTETLVIRRVDDHEVSA